MANEAKDSGEDRSETVAFRTSTVTKQLIQALATRDGVPPSEWLRTVVEEAVSDRIVDSGR